MKSIQLSEKVYKRLMEDRKEFEEKNGIHYDFNDTVSEYQKILDTITN